MVSSQLTWSTESIFLLTTRNVVGNLHVHPFQVPEKSPSSKLFKGVHQPSVSKDYVGVDVSGFFIPHSEVVGIWTTVGGLVRTEDSHREGIDVR